MFAGSLVAKTGPGVYDARAPEKRKIRAGALPEVVDEDRCPVEGRVIVDSGIGAVVPKPGMAVAAEGMSPEGDQYLVVSNPRGDEFSLESVGPEPRSEASSGLETRASGPSAARIPTTTPGTHRSTTTTDGTPTPAASPTTSRRPGP
jgi:hypothetical protein